LKLIKNISSYQKSRNRATTFLGCGCVFLL
jgi:hypothetical protein